MTPRHRMQAKSAQGAKQIRELNANAHSAVYRLKKDLAQVIKLDGDCIENDGQGRFRLSVPPGNITYDEVPMKTHHPLLFEQYEPKTRLVLRPALR